MDIQKGRIVKASAGRDGGRYFAVVGEKDGFILIADGKTRKLSSPENVKISDI